MKIFLRHSRIYSLAVFCALASVFLIMSGCSDDDDNGGGGPTKVTYSISGQATSAGSGLSGVTMTLSGGKSTAVTTDASGNYTFTGLDNGSYTITPSKTGFTFSPNQSPQTVSGVNITGVNFTATPVPTYSISGQVTSTGPGSSGVTMTLDGLSGGRHATTITDASGNYTFTGLDNGSYTITPSRTGFTFSPTSSPRTVSGSNITGVNFTATQVQKVTHSISGQVTSSGSGLSGVTMTLSGASSATTITDASGNYTFTGLDNGSYTITPSRTGFTFSPTSSLQTVSGADITGVNFTATQVTVTHSISGQVMSGSSGLSGVTMTLSGASSVTTTTNASGNYVFTGLANGTYTVTPSKTGFTFTPASMSQTVSGADITGENFTATSTQSAQIVACPASGTITVGMANFAFSPQSVTIAANGIVKFNNNDTVTHRPASGTSPTADGKFDTGNMGPGATVCVQFFATGTYPYFCEIHTFMIGSVLVQ